MKCPKCHYLSFEPEPRCRNCGYDLALADADLAMREFESEDAEAPAADLPLYQETGEPEPVAKIRRLVGVHFSVLEQSPALAEVVQVELRQGHKFFRGASAHEVSAYFELIASVLEEGVAGGYFHADLPVKVATKRLFGAMDQMATSWVLGKRGYRLVDAADTVATIFLKGVTRDGV